MRLKVQLTDFLLSHSTSVKKSAIEKLSYEGKNLADVVTASYSRTNKIANFYKGT